MTKKEDRDAKLRQYYLLALGTVVILWQLLIELIRPGNFRSDFLLAGCALCGVALSLIKGKE